MAGSTPQTRPPPSEVVALVRAACEGRASAQYNLGLSILSGDDTSSATSATSGEAEPNKVLFVRFDPSC